MINHPLCKMSDAITCLDFNTNRDWNTDLNYQNSWSQINNSENKILGGKLRMVKAKIIVATSEW